MSDEWWATETEVETTAGPPAVRKPRELDEVDKYRAPSQVTAKWVESQLTKTEWSEVKRTQGSNKLNPHLIESMARDAKKGLSKRSIMARHGYSVATWNAWEQKAMEGVQPYTLWYQCMMLSVSSVEEDLIENIKMAGMSDWKASKWLLEQINKDEYTPVPKNQVINVAGDVNEKKSVNYLSEADSVQVAKLLQSIGVIPEIENVVEGEVVEDND